MNKEKKSIAGLSLIIIGLNLYFKENDLFMLTLNLIFIFSVLIFALIKYLTKQIEFKDFISYVFPFVLPIIIMTVFLFFLK